MPTRNKGKRLRISPRVSLRKSVVTAPRQTIEIGRNDPCPCGSGEKYKNCCITKGDAYLRNLGKAKAKEEAKLAKEKAKEAKKVEKEAQKLAKMREKTAKAKA